MYPGTLIANNTFPKNNQLDVALDVPVEVVFNTFIDQQSIDGAIFITTNSGTNIPVIGTVDIATKALQIKPMDGFWAGNTTYFVNIVGLDNALDTAKRPQYYIRDVLGNPLFGSVKFTFTTVRGASLQEPEIVGPVSGTVIKTWPEFSWKPVNEAESYELRISLSNTMDPIKWSNDNIENTSVTPDVQLPEGLVYWQVRAINATNTGVWSPIQVFHFSDDVIAPVSEQDVLPFDPVLDPGGPLYKGTGDNGVLPLQVVKVFPEDNASNLSTKLKVVYIQVDQAVTREDIDSGEFSITGISLDGDTESDHGNVALDGIQLMPQVDGTTIIGIVIKDLPSA